MFTVVFALGIGLAGAAGTLLMWDPTWGASVPLAAETLLPAFIVVIVGGLGTFRGTVVAARSSAWPTRYDLVVPERHRVHGPAGTRAVSGPRGDTHRPPARAVGVEEVGGH